MAICHDRFGLGWRHELAAGILTNLQRIDVVEVIADDYFAASRKRKAALRSLAGEVPLLLHSIGLGMASTVAVEEKRLARMARLIEHVRPESWSEHLAFVRGGGIEIGHLASPPRNANVVESTLANVERATRITGVAPAMENVASFIDPPCSSLTEAAFLASMARSLPAGMLLDLHNIYTNSINFGYDPYVLLETFPLDRVASIHIAGGRWMGRRMLDDHLHDVPDPVYELLAYVASRTARPLTVILERDGAYPRMEDLLAQIDMARAAVARGRAKVTAA
ncbi:MAG: DUF692 domain-containing protein [Acidobacteria bacterium]|nr:DUF692 domain-containing protein [Acidobacteriota bacterium]